MKRFRNARSINTASPEEQLAWMRSLPAKRGAAKRIAGLPVWDGHVRFGDVDDAPWSDEDIHTETWASLQLMARGEGHCGSQNDPNDPPVVKRDILNHPYDPWR